MLSMSIWQGRDFPATSILGAFWQRATVYVAAWMRLLLCAMRQNGETSHGILLAS